MLAMFRDKERGAALIEFVLVVPLLLLLIFGIIEFSVLFYDKAVITNISREAAREFAIYRQPPITSKALYNIVTLYTQDRMISFTGATDPSLETYLDSVLSEAAVKNSGTEYVTAKVTYTYDWFLLPSFMNDAFPDIDLTATTVMRNEGFEP